MVFGELIPVVADGGRRRVWRGALFATTAVVLLTVTACSSGGSLGPSASASGSVANGGAGTPSAAPSAAEPTVSLTGKAASISYLKPVKMTVADGSFSSVQVSTKGSDQTLDGTVSGDGTSWTSEGPPKPSVSYNVVARVTDAAGQEKTKSVKFKVATVPDEKRVSFSVTPQAGSTVGIGQPIVVRFLTPITRRAAMERVMTVTGKTKTGGEVVGSWHWLNSQQVDWRPKEFWKPGTKVTLDMQIAGVKAANDRYGRKDYKQTFKIGASHVTKVDGTSHKIRVYRDGKLVDTWPTGTGRPGLETYSGTYIVLGKSPVVQMDSCSARIECDKKAPDYYDEKEYWATRVTASGTFLHAASWDGLLGRANVSHGCIHLSDADAKIFYNHAVIGDVVIVSRTGRGPQERIATQDPGLYDWNLSWSAWKKGSAL
jgi:lipoprotein-anchoring transpeptidase ErfK/SrfK